jgi:imidazolonepropionase-like amidohydrolase
MHANAPRTLRAQLRGTSAAALCWLAIVTVPTALRAEQVAPPATSALDHVTVIPMAAQGPDELDDVTVVIRQGRIISVGPTGATVFPNGARHIDGRGKWLMPGLADMHVHTLNDRMARLYLHDPSIRDGTLDIGDLFALYLANGVTQILDLQSMSETIGQKLDIEAGRVLGPHLATAAMIDGSPPSFPVGMLRVATTPEDGRQTVRDAQAEGYDFIKVYSRLDLDTFGAIVEQARQLNMRVVGHIPARGKGITGKFFQPGYELVAHAEEFAQQTDHPDLNAIPSYVEMAKRNGSWLIATLTTDDRILEETSHPETLHTRPELQYLPLPLRSVVMDHNPYVARATPAYIQLVGEIVAFNRQLVRAFTAAGIPVLTGTDSPVPGMVPGFALHDELEAMAAAGMTNKQVLEGSTRLACQWLRVDADRGTVETGKRADLLLLDADPLKDVANTRKIAGLILGGRYFSRSELDRMLQKTRNDYASKP